MKYGLTQRRINIPLLLNDADFYDLVTLKGHPPKIIWLRIGNTSTNDLVGILKHYSDLIRKFLNDEEYSEIACLEIS
jgi:predicted nuclease of predicted toxin-antitoxin system